MSGFVAFAGRAPNPELSGALLSMSARIAHRGDLEAAVSFSERCGTRLRHREQAGFRVDTHADANRAIVLDGLVVNRPQLSRELGADTTLGAAELVLAGFERHGDAWLAKLDGSFAIFLADLRTGEVVLARDRFGHRPLYFAMGGDVVWVASEIKALLAVPGTPSVPNRSVLPAAIGYGVTPGPDTLFTGIRKCVPGFVFRLGPRGDCRTEPYFKPAVPLTRDLKLADAKEAVWSTLAQTVTEYAEACPSVGILLSGGVDSALLACQLRDLTKGRAPAISFGAAEWEREESAEAETLARQLGLPFSRTFVRPEDDLVGALRTVVTQLEEPTRFENAVALALTYPEAAGKCAGILTGEGGDSTLGEHEHFKARRLSEILRLPGTVRSVIAALPVGMLGRGRLRSLADYCRHASLQEFVQRSVENCPDLVSGAQHPPEVALQDSIERVIVGWPPAAQYIYIDLLEFKHAWIERMEKLASASGLECFHPFQSNAMLDLGLALPEHLRLSDGHTKPILRALANDRLGSDVAYRAKRQLAAPMMLWLNRSASLRARVLRLKNSESRIREYLDNAAVDRHLANYEQRGADSGVTTRTIFRMLSFELWLEIFG